MPGTTTGELSRRAAGVAGFGRNVAPKVTVKGLTRAAARKFDTYGIGVNAVSSGLVTDDPARPIDGESVITATASSRWPAHERHPNLLGTVPWLIARDIEFVRQQIVDGGGVVL